MKSSRDIAVSGYLREAQKAINPDQRNVMDLCQNILTFYGQFGFKVEPLTFYGDHICFAILKDENEYGMIYHSMFRQIQYILCTGSIFRWNLV